jgi:hypothetical protein
MQGNQWAIEERTEAEERQAAIEDRYKQLYTRELDRMRVLNMVDMVDIEEISSFTSSISPNGSTGKKKPSKRGKRNEMDSITDDDLTSNSDSDSMAMTGDSSSPSPSSIQSAADLYAATLESKEASRLLVQQTSSSVAAGAGTPISVGDNDSGSDALVQDNDSNTNEVDGPPGEDAGEAFPKAQRDEWMAKATREITLQREVMAAAAEKIVRFKRPLTQYVIAMMRERNIDVIDAERNTQLASNSKKK